MSARRRPAATVAAVVTAVLLVGCGGSTDEPSTDAPPPADDTVGDDADDGGGSDGAALEEEISQARELLGEDAGAGAAEVVVAERVTWPDAALGCPEPDQVYTQALVEGYRIVLAVDGDEVAFHGAEGEPPFRCEAPQPPAS